MRAKTIFIIIVTVLLTIILMNNTGNITLWIFQEMELSIILVFGVIFSLGFVLGFLARGKRKQPEQEVASEQSNADAEANRSYLDTSDDGYSDEEYIR